MITVLQHDETESGPRVRKALYEHHGISCNKIREVDRLLTGAFTSPHVVLWAYIRPSTGATIYIIEAQLFYPPDAVVWRSYVLEGAPSDEQIREIIAVDAGEGYEL